VASSLKAMSVVEGHILGAKYLVEPRDLLIVDTSSISRQGSKTVGFGDGDLLDCGVISVPESIENVPPKPVGRFTIILNMGRVPSPGTSLATD